MEILQNPGEFNLPVIPSVGGEAVTMSSREIAVLCEKQHKHILRDIEKMLLDIGEPKFGLSSFEYEYTTPQNKKAKEYRLPKDLTVTLITGYRADLRYKVVKRLEELEGQTPKLTGRQLMAAALIEADATINEQVKQIEGMREDVEAHDRLSKADGTLNVTEAAKTLGLRRKDLFDWLSHNGWIYRRSGGKYWLGYQDKCNRGLLEHKTTVVYRADGSEAMSEQVRIPAKGLTHLAKVVPGVAKEVH